MPSKVLLVFCSLVVCGCVQAPEPAIGDQVQQARAVTDTGSATADQSQPLIGTPTQDSARDRWVESAFLPTNAKLESVIAAFGQPDSLETLIRPNVHDTTQVDTIFRVVYDRGLRVSVFKGGGGKEFLTYAEITGPGFLRDSTVNIGMRWDAVTEKLGPPLGEIFDDPYYDSYRRGGADEPVVLVIEDGVVRRIRFLYYSG